MHAEHHFAESLIALGQRFPCQVPFGIRKIVNLGPVLSIVWLYLAAVDSTQCDVRPRCDVNYELPDVVRRWNRTLHCLLGGKRSDELLH